MGLLDIVPAGVVTGDNLRKLLQYGIYYMTLITLKQTRF